MQTKPAFAQRRMSEEKLGQKRNAEDSAPPPAKKVIRTNVLPVTTDAAMHKIGQSMARLIIVGLSGETENDNIYILM